MDSDRNIIFIKTHYFFVQKEGMKCKIGKLAKYKAIKI